MNKAEAVIAVLDGTHRILSMHGVWVNYFPAEGGGHHCLLTALSEARQSIEHEENLVDAAVILLVEVIGSESIPAWNDAPDRKLPEVLDAVTKAAARARERLR